MVRPFYAGPLTRSTSLFTRKLGWSVAAAALLAVVAYASTFAVSYGDLFRADDPLLASDVARLAPARIARAEHARDVEQLRAVLE
ncbi:MAG: hypothetical protein ACREME_11825, partial [Gemmatimonadales bacterium]